MSAPSAAYDERLARHAAERAAAAARSRALGSARLLVFAGLVAAGVWAEQRPGPLPFAALAVAAAAFLVLVAAHARVRRRARWAADLVRVQEDGLARLARAWQRLPPRPAPTGVDDHHLATDLDLFGRPALAQLLGPTGTPAGGRALAGWLLACARPGEVAARQEAVRVLAGTAAWRDAMAVHAHRAATVTSADAEAFLDWAEAEPWLTERRWLLWTARLLPLLTLVLAGLELAGLLEPSLWILSLAGAGVLALGPTGRRVDATFDRAFAREGIFHEIPELLTLAVGVPVGAARLEEIRARAAGGGGAPRALGRLRQLMYSADVRHGPGIFYLPLVLLTLWPFHVLARLERWQARCGPHARDWLDALGELEALAALAALAHDNPGWAYPEVVADAASLTAEALGHPMLPPAARVDNDVEVGPPGTFLLVTGSNMSGKSTLLRALGANVVLAGAGAPVCAARLRMPAVELRTSVHVEDSLTEGISFFMAQLRRVREIVAAADAAAEGGPRVCYLLDEILAGTNSAERRVAATRVIGHLVERSAIGAVSTHDLELAGEGALGGAARPVHFSETVHTAADTRAMSFDYRLRPGVATSTNALKLMALVGLGPSAVDADQ